MPALKIPAFKQETVYTCGPACIRMILAYYGVDLSERDLAHKLGTKENLGTAPRHLRSGAKLVGLTGRWSKKATIADLEKSIKNNTPVIVNWFSHDDGHYSVVTGVDQKTVTIIDPEDGKTRSFPRDVFMRVWFDFPSPYINHRYQMRIRWMLPLRKA